MHQTQNQMSCQKSLINLGKCETENKVRPNNSRYPQARFRCFADNKYYNLKCSSSWEIQWSKSMSSGICGTSIRIILVTQDSINEKQKIDRNEKENKSWNDYRCNCSHHHRFDIYRDR